MKAHAGFVTDSGKTARESDCEPGLPGQAPWDPSVPQVQALLANGLMESVMGRKNIP
jgi:hypothetical protein